MSQDGGEYHRRRRAKLYTCKNCIRHRKEEARVQQREPELRGYQRAHSVQILETPRPREIRFWIGTPVRLVSAGRWIPLMEGGGDMMMLVPLKGESSGHRRPWHPGEGAGYLAGFWRVTTYILDLSSWQWSEKKLHRARLNAILLFNNHLCKTVGHE